MKILALEFSSGQRGAAVIEAHSDSTASTATVLGCAMETGGHSALGLVQEALRQAGCEREQIETIVVGLGPGSYTGIRGAVALAQGWQLGRGVNVLGISSVECLAAGIAREKACGVVNIVIDAQRNEFYLARYETTADGAYRETQPLRLAPFAEIEELGRRGEPIIGPALAKWFPSASIRFPDAAILGSLAATRRSYVPAEKLEPIYLREITFKKAPTPRTVE